jgi:hypothetical protein
MYASALGRINIFGLKARLFPALLSFPDALQRAPALWRTEVLQRTSARTDESLVAAGTVAGMVEKNVL